MANFLVMLQTTAAFRAPPLLKLLDKEYGEAPCEAWTGEGTFAAFVAGAPGADVLYEFARGQKNVKSVVVLELGRDGRVPGKGDVAVEWLADHGCAHAGAPSKTKGPKTAVRHVYLYKGHELHCNPEHTMAGRYSARLIVIDTSGKTVLKRGFPTMEDFISEADAVEHARLCGEDMVSGTTE